jgi:hypothetical protein
MSNLTCPGCGSVYPLAAVQKLDHFTCAVCHQTIVVPIAGPAPSRAAPPPPVRAQPFVPPLATPRPVPAYQPPPPPVPHAPHAPRHHHAPVRAPDESGPNWGLIGAVGAVIAAVVVGILFFTGDKPGAENAGVATSPAAPKPDVKPAAAAPSAPDPEKDPSAWKALPAAERADRTIRYLASLDGKSPSALSNAYTFLKARDEPEAVQKVAEMELARDPTSGWAHQARGDSMVLDRVEHCLTECARADEADTPAVQKLNKLKKDHAPETGVWWADASVQKDVDATIAQIRADEKTLQDPYEWAVAKWRVYQRRIEVMRDYPAITDTVGPYLIFVQVKATPGTPLESVPETEMNRAKRVLNQSKTVFSACYDGFHDAFGKTLGVARYDKSNLDAQTILKANVFADESTWELYHQKLGFLPFLTGVRAYYEAEEPRFVVSYDPGDDTAAQSERVQCREATLQLLHFYTWDVSRKADGRELTWAQCLPRPLWVDEGFAEFFSSHRRDGGKYVWMQPLEPRMQSLWTFSQVFQKKRWAMWSLDEILAIVDGEQVTDQATKRAVPKAAKQFTPEQQAAVAQALELLRPVFYSKAWSLVYFLWNQTDASGRPVYRERFAAFLKESLHVRQVNVEGRGLQTRTVTASDFRKAMGLEAEDRYRAFEKEWLAWEAAFLDKAKTDAWAKYRDDWLQKLGVK